MHIWNKTHLRKGTLSTSTTKKIKPSFWHVSVFHISNTEGGNYYCHNNLKVKIKAQIRIKRNFGKCLEWRYLHAFSDKLSKIPHITKWQLWIKLNVKNIRALWQTYSNATRKRVNSKSSIFLKGGKEISDFLYHGTKVNKSAFLWHWPSSDSLLKNSLFKLCLKMHSFIFWD